MGEEIILYREIIAASSSIRLSTQRAFTQACISANGASTRYLTREDDQDTGRFHRANFNGETDRVLLTCLLVTSCCRFIRYLYIFLWYSGR